MARLARNKWVLYNESMHKLNPHLVDSHFHLLSIQRKGIDIETLLASMQEASVEGIDVGLDCDDLAVRTKLLAPYPLIHLSAGIGPWGAVDSLDEQLAKLESQLAHNKVVAIGEIGLDNYHKYGTVENQEYLVGRQIELANRIGRPVIFHNREADNQFISLLGRTTFAKRGIFHCYQGGTQLAHLAIERGFYLSFAGPLTYKANKAMQDLFVSLPLEHLLLETDSPYLSPNPVRGTVNTPLSMQHIYACAAQLRGLALEALIEQIRANFHTFVGQ